MSLRRGRSGTGAAEDDRVLDLLWHLRVVLSMICCLPVVISNHAVKLQKPMSCRGRKLHGQAWWSSCGGWNGHPHPTGARAGWAGAPGRPQKRGRRTKPVLVSRSQLYLNNFFYNYWFNVIQLALTEKVSKCMSILLNLCPRVLVSEPGA